MCRAPRTPAPGTCIFLVLVYQAERVQSGVQRLCSPERVRHGCMAGEDWLEEGWVSIPPAPPLGSPPRWLSPVAVLGMPVLSSDLRPLSGALLLSSSHQCWRRRPVWSPGADMAGCGQDLNLSSGISEDTTDDPLRLWHLIPSGAASTR